MAELISQNYKKRPYKVKSGVAIAKGDLVYCDAADGFTIKPASSFTWNSTLATTQTGYALRFAGVADFTYDGTTFTGAPSAYGLQNGQGMVLEDGVFEDDCASATFYPGTLVGPAKQSGNALEASKVVQTSTEATSIGRVYEYASAVTKVKFSIHPQLADITTSADAGS